jgi:glutathione S-transferase
MAVEAALRRKGLEYERVELTAGPHVQEMQRLYGEGRSTVPGLLIDGEAVHGSRPIFARLEELAPKPALFPEPIADAVREAERWGDDELQDLVAATFDGNVMLPLPFQVPPLELYLYWHANSDQDAAGRWLRDHVFAAMAEVAVDDAAAALADGNG